MQLVVNEGKSKGWFIRVNGPRFLIGRDPGCQLRPASEQVSGRHAELRIVAGIVLITDLGSATGTRVNGETVRGPVSLRTGDRIEIGPLCCTVLLDDVERPRRPKHTVEDQAASWLTDEEDDRSDAPGMSRVSATPAGGSAGGNIGSLVGAANQPTSGRTNTDGSELSRAMTVRTD